MILWMVIITLGIQKGKIFGNIKHNSDKNTEINKWITKLVTRIAIKKIGFCEINLYKMTNYYFI